MKKKTLLKLISPEISRKKFIKGNKNFIYLLNKRLDWMKKYTKNKKNVLEFGSSNCLTKIIISNKIICTDKNKNKFIDFELDMNNLKLPKKYKKKYDVLIFNHCLHHSKNPIKVLENVSKKMIKNGSYVLINEPETSLIFKIFLKIFNHEKYDDNKKNIKKRNFWYENNSTGKLLFANKKVNDIFLKNYKIISNDLNEFLIFLNCSGNGVDTPYIPLNMFLLKLLDKIDNFLIKLFPKIFALNRKIVLKKI